METSEPAGRLDLDDESASALEFGEILGWISGLARTGPGRILIEGLRPSLDQAAIRHEHASWSEMADWLAVEAALLPAALPDPGPPLDRLTRMQEALEPLDLLDLARFLRSADDARRRLRNLDPGRSPLLAERGSRLPSWAGEVDPILASVEPDGSLRDEASPELTRIRRARTRLGESLRGTLLALLRDPESESAIRDDFVTERNGRYVIPVRTDAPRPIRGIVHATSSTGATRFVEPLETLEMNNELIRLVEEERYEIDRILKRWTAAIRRRGKEAGQTVATLAELDSLQARAGFARELRGVVPVVGAGQPLRLRQMRHALLDRRLREGGEGCSPLDLGIDPPDSILVLSGPNAGGKTVALKSLGLTVLMAQSGIPVAAEEARLPLFHQVRADIGDHQSIDEDLSTFSGHIRAIAAALKDRRPPALFLFDEIGGGTDPAEGAALAQSILEALRLPGMTVVATTHQGAVKAWAATADGAKSAAMEFDTSCMRPTFRILEGVAGGSAGIEIARRYGLPEDLIERAREALGPDNRRSEDYLARLRERISQVDERLKAVDDRERELADERHRLSEASRREREEWRRTVGERLDAEVEALRRRSRKELAGLREERERRRVERELGRVEAEARRQAGRVREELAPGSDGPREGWKAVDRVEEGQEVWVRSLGRSGVVRSVRGRDVEVLLGRMPFRVDLDDLWGGAGSPPARKPAEPAKASVFVQGRSEAPGELMLIGLRVDEALDQLDRYLDEAARGSREELRVVHGHGTGRLRRAVREHLRDHALVAEQRPGRSGEGGDGATVVRLR